MQKQQLPPTGPGIGGREKVREIIEREHCLNAAFLQPLEMQMTKTISQVVMLFLLHLMWIQHHNVGVNMGHW